MCLELENFVHKQTRLVRKLWAQKDSRIWPIRFVSGAGMLLDGQACDRDVERFRMEVAVQTCETQARLLEDIAAGKVLELQSQGGSRRFNIVCFVVCVRSKE